MRSPSSVPPVIGPLPYTLVADGPIRSQECCAHGTHHQLGVAGWDEEPLGIATEDQFPLLIHQGDSPEVPVERRGVEEGVDAFGFGLGYLSGKGGNGGQGDQDGQDGRDGRSTRRPARLVRPVRPSALSALLIRHPWIRFRIEEIGKKIDQHEQITLADGVEHVAPHSLNPCARALRM